VKDVDRHGLTIHSKLVKLLRLVSYLPGPQKLMASELGVPI